MNLISKTNIHMMMGFTSHKHVKLADYVLNRTIGTVFCIVFHANSYFIQGTLRFQQSQTVRKAYSFSEESTKSPLK